MIAEAMVVAIFFFVVGLATGYSIAYRRAKKTIAEITETYLSAPHAGKVISPREWPDPKVKPKVVEHTESEAECMDRIRREYRLGDTFVIEPFGKDAPAPKRDELQGLLICDKCRRRHYPGKPYDSFWVFSKTGCERCGSAPPHQRVYPFGRTTNPPPRKK